MEKNAKKRKRSVPAHERIQVNTRIAKIQRDLAKPSAEVKCSDPEFLPKFTELWDEHVPGFTGLRGVKRELSEKEKNMEWRVRLAAKRKAANAKQIGKSPSLSNAGKPRLAGGVVGSTGKSSTPSKSVVAANRAQAIAQYKLLKKAQAAAKKKR